MKVKSVISILTLLSLAWGSPPWICYRMIEWNNHVFAFYQNKPTNLNPNFMCRESDFISQNNASKFYSPTSTQQIETRILIEGQQDIAAKMIPQLFDLFCKNGNLHYTFHDLQITFIYPILEFLEEMTLQKRSYTFTSSSKINYFSQLRAPKGFQVRNDIGKAWSIIGKDWELAAYYFFLHKETISKKLDQIAIFSKHKITFSSPTNTISLQISDQISTRIIVALALFASLFKLNLHLELEVAVTLNKELSQLLSTLISKDLNLSIEILSNSSKLSLKQALRGFHVELSPKASSSLYQLFDQKEHLISGISILDDKRLHCWRGKPCCPLIFDHIRRTIIYFPEVQNLKITMKEAGCFGDGRGMALLEQYKKIQRSSSLESFDLACEINSLQAGLEMIGYSFDFMFKMLSEKFPLLTSISLKFTENSIQSKGNSIPLAIILASQLEKYRLPYLKKLAFHIPQTEASLLNNHTWNLLEIIPNLYPKLSHFTLDYGNVHWPNTYQAESFVREMKSLQYLYVNGYEWEKKAQN